MIFHPDLAAKILAGTKTQTRRPRGGLMECRYEAGRDYAVQPGRGKQAIARIRILTVTAEMASQISEDDARAEGFASRRQFFRRWKKMYPAWDPDRSSFEDLVWRIEFELL